MGQAKGEERLHKGLAANEERCAYYIVCRSVTRTRKELKQSLTKGFKHSIHDLHRTKELPKRPNK